MRRYMIFDIETIVDWDFVHLCEGEFGESRDDCIKRYKQVIREKQKLSDFDEPFMPEKYHTPVAAAFIALDENGNYLAHKVIGDLNTGYVTKEFWRLFQGAKEQLNIDTFVTFNGKRFDMPVMEVNGIRHGCAMDRWYNLHPKYASDNPRGRFNNEAHLDLMPVLAEHSGAGGSLSFWATTMGLPGKVCIDGSVVAGLIATGSDGLTEVMDYCLADVLTTTAVLLHLLRMTGEIPSGITPIRACSQMMDSVIKAVLPSGIDGGCVQSWAKEYEACKKNRESKEALADDDYIPF